VKRELSEEDAVAMTAAIQRRALKTALLCKINFALILDCVLLFHFNSDINIHYISILYRTILCEYFI